MKSSNRGGNTVASWPLALAVGLASSAAGCAVESRAAQEPVGTTGAALSLNTVTLESVDNQGDVGSSSSYNPSISGNQQYVVFTSASTNWTPSTNTNGAGQIFLKNRNSGAITLVSASGGVAGNAGSYNASVSDTDVVAFATDATNLAPGATGPYSAIIASSGGGNSRVDIALSGQPNGASSQPQISGDGSTVVFQSDASNLVSGDTNGFTDVFVRDLSSNTVTLVSLAAGGIQANGPSYGASISYDGRYVAFTSDASNLQYNDGNGVSDVFLYDRTLGYVRPVSFSTTGQGGSVGNGASDLAQVSGDGQHVSFRSYSVWDSGDTNSVTNTFITDFVGTIANAPHRVNVSTAGVQADNPSWQSAPSYDGSAVAFASAATNLVDGVTAIYAGVYVRERTTGQTVRADQRDPQTQAIGGSVALGSTIHFSGNPGVPSWSFLAFDSSAWNLTWSPTSGNQNVYTASLSP
jgi:WD40-like Beta Propeller Repeat